MFGYTLIEILMVILIPLAYLMPLLISMFRDINKAHWLISSLMTICAMFLPYPFWFVALVFSLMPRKAVEFMLPHD